MSKKNKLSTRRNQHAFNAEREKKLAEERKEKAEKRKKQTERKNKLGALVVKRKSKRGIKLKRNSVVKGIKIKNAASKAKARERLMAEAALKMQVEKRRREQQYKVYWWSCGATGCAEHTHADLHPALLQGTLAGLVPHAKNNHGVKVTNMCNHFKAVMHRFSLQYARRFQRGAEDVRIHKSVGCTFGPNDMLMENTTRER